MTDWPIRIVIRGKAEPAGSKTGFVIPGTKRVSIVDANKKAKPWKQGVAADACDQYKGEPLTCAVDVLMVFTMPRPKGHYGTGRNAQLLKENAPLQPTVAPDVLKLARGVEDALTGIVYRDDAQIVNEALQKRYGETPMVEILVRPTALTCVRDLLIMDMADVAPPEMIEYQQLALV